MRTQRWLAALALGLATSVAAGNVLPLLDAAGALSRKHAVSILLDPDVPGSLSAPIGWTPSGDLERDLDALADHSGLRWRRDEHGTYRLTPGRTASAKLDALLVVAPDADTIARVALPSERADGINSAAARTTIATPALAVEPDFRAERLGRRVPNVSGSGSAFSIRGIARDDALAATSSVLLDGIPVSPLALDRDAIDLFDIATIEYERGPASAHAGPFSLAGIVRIQSESPASVFAGFAQRERSELGSTRAGIAVGGALDDAGRWPLRVAARWRHEASDIRIADTDRRVEDREHRGVSLRARHVPDSAEDLVVDLTIHALEIDGPVAALVTSAASEDFDPHARTTAEPTRPEFLDGALARLVMSRAVGTDARVWLTASRAEFDVASSAPRSRFDREDLASADRDDRAGAWLDWAPWARLRIILGAEHARRIVWDTTLAATDLAAYFPPAVVVAPTSERVFLARDADVVRTTSAVLEVKARIGSLTTSLGVRRTLDERRSDSVVSASLQPKDCEIRLGASRFTCSEQFPDRETRLPSRSRASVTLPSAAISGPIGNRASWSLGYRTGYRSGGELEVEWRASDAWRLSAGWGALRTRYDSFTLPGVGGDRDVGGNEFPDAPRETVAVGARWQGPGGWYGGVNAWRNAAAWSDPSNTPALRRPAYTVVDARIGYRTARFDVYASAVNLFDADWLEDVELRGGTAAPARYRTGTPRTVAIGVVVNW